jgi:predicted Zn-dependent protease
LVRTSADREAEWTEALARAARALPAEDAAAQIFHEFRDDLRVEIGPDSQVSAVATRLHGARVRRTTPRPRETFLSAPTPSELEDLVRGRVQVAEAGSSWREDHSTSVTLDADPIRIATWLEATSRRFAALARGTSWTFAARWVGFRQRIHVGRPGGEVVTDSRTGVTLRVEVGVRSADGRSGRAVWEAVAKTPEPTALDDRLGELLDRARAGLDGRLADTGPTCVVLAPGPGGVLVHELIGHALEADTVLRGASWLGSAVPKVAPEEFTVVDDPRRGRGAWKIDDEGVRCRVTPLIESGRVAGYIHDLDTAARSGRSPTGHGRRSSFREAVRPRMGCTFVAPGGLDPEEILRDTSGGIYVRRMRSASTDTRSGGARFLVTDADRIDGGRLVHCVRPFVLEARCATVLESIDRVGSDLEFDTCIGSCVRDGQPLSTSVGAPTLRIGVATVVG